MMNNNQAKSNSKAKTITLIGLFLGAAVLTIGVALSYMGFFNSDGQTDLSKKIVDANYDYSQTAYFAGGCFWCMEGIFEKQEGVEGAYSGYTGGEESTATYEQTSAKNTQHREAVRVVYDPDVISYRKLVELYWTQTDPTDGEGQFNDRGFVYSPAIYYSNDEEKNQAQASKTELQESGRFDEPIATVIVEATPFYDAEDYHQNYYKENSIRYNLYTSGSGRKEFIEENWQDRIDELEGKEYINGELVEKEQSKTPSNQYTQEELRERLTPLQYKVTREQGTEPAFDNQYWDNKEPGIYVDILDGTPLYSSLDKFDSGTGWPSFTQSIDENNIKLDIDTRFFMTRTKVDSVSSGNHLGHIFEDAPEELGGIRHCINSASLRFVPLENLEEEGYGEYIESFENREPIESGQSTQDTASGDLSEQENQSQDMMQSQDSSESQAETQNADSITTETQQDTDSTDQVQDSQQANISTQSNQTFSVPALNGVPDKTDAELKAMLTPIQYAIAIESKTEKAYSNQYYDNKKAGIYVDVVDGTPLFSSRDKYDSGTGWPAFTKPLKANYVTEHEDNELSITRTEVKSATSGAHLGHIFADGPEDRGGLRYCINSASMRFIALEDMESSGYGEYISMVQ